MAFNTVTDAGTLNNGWAYERGTWLGTAVTTGTITPGAGTNFPSNTPKVSKIYFHSQSSDGNTAVTPNVGDATAAFTLVLTFTSGDAGTYCISGPSSGS